MKKNRIKAAFRGLAECRACGVRDLVLFSDLAETDFNLIHQPIDEIFFEAGSVIYNEGDTGHWVFTVRSGLIKLVQHLPEGTQRIVRLLRQGAAAGLESVLGGPYEHSAEVLTAALVCRIPVSTVKELDVETPRLHQQLMERWHQSVHEADAWLTQLSTGNAKARIARLLLSLPIDPGGERELFSIEDLGAMLGITPETASRVMAEFKRAGAVVHTSNHHFRCNVDALNGILND